MLMLGGMGREVAIGFAKEGASAMVLGDINEAGLIATAEMIKSQSPSVMVVTMTLDVSSPENVQQFVDQLVTKFGRLDYAVNAAGIAPAPNELTDAPSNSLARSLNVNTKGVLMVPLPWPFILCTDTCDRSFSAARPRSDR